METPQERMKRVQLEIIDKYLEHAMTRMETRKMEIEDEAYLIAKAVGLQIVNKQKR